VIPDLDVASNLMIDRLAEDRLRFLAQTPELCKTKHERSLSRWVSTSTCANRSLELGVADRQLIAIARAMSHQPSLLILDEPTSSLSASEAERLFRLIER
jgi:simple sugar transport system ATP-binding protein